MRDPSAFVHIPQEYWEQQQFCFWLHDQMADVLRQCEERKIATVTVTFDNEQQRLEVDKADDILEGLKNIGKDDVVKRIVANQTVIPLFSDLLHFIYEALTCLERRKITVALALLRKPLKYSLLMATLLFVDEDDFYRRLAEPADELNERAFPPERIRQLLKSAIERFGDNTGLDADTLYQILFERGNIKGLAPYFDMASHLVTSYKKIRTNSLNLNFIFRKPSDTSIYGAIYFPLAYVLLYLFMLEAFLFGKMAIMSDQYVNWAKMAMTGTFLATFGLEVTPVVAVLNETFRDVLQCVACGERITVSSGDLVTLFLAETIVCDKCGTTQQFPLFWLVTRVTSIVADGPNETNQ